MSITLWKFCGQAEFRDHLHKNLQRHLAFFAGRMYIAIIQHTDYVCIEFVEANWLGGQTLIYDHKTHKLLFIKIRRCDQSFWESMLCN